MIDTTVLLQEVQLFSLKGNLGYIDLHNISTSLGSREKIDRIEGRKLQERLKESNIISSLLFLNGKQCHSFFLFD